MKANHDLIIPAMAMAWLLNASLPTVRAADLQIASFDPQFELPPEIATNVVPLRWVPHRILVKVRINDLDAGVDLSIGINGMNLLQLACRTGAARVVAALLEAGIPAEPVGISSKNAPPSRPSSRQSCPPGLARPMAASYGQVNAVRLLLAAGAKPDALHPEKKTTALENASARHDQTIIALLKQTKPH